MAKAVPCMAVSVVSVDVSPPMVDRIAWHISP
jgi:hypothetical protein